MKTKTYYLYINGIFIFETISRKRAVKIFDFLLLHLKQSSNMVLVDDSFNVICSTSFSSLR